MDSLEPTNLAGNLVRNYFGQRFWMIFACFELKYNEFKCFGASALGFCQTEKWVSMKVTVQQGGGTGAASLGQTWVPFRPNAGTKSIPCTSRSRHNPCQPQPCLSEIDSKSEVWYLMLFLIFIMLYLIFFIKMS